MQILYMCVYIHVYILTFNGINHTNSYTLTVVLMYCLFTVNKQVKVTQHQHNKNTLKTTNMWQRMPTTGHNFNVWHPNSRPTTINGPTNGCMDGSDRAFIHTNTGYIAWNFGEWYQNRHNWSVLCLSLIHIWRCRRIERCRSRWSPYH